MSKNRAARSRPAPGAIDGYDAREMNVIEDGRRENSSLLLIHGTAASLAWWNPVVPELIQHHHVIRLDLPGHGQSAPARSYGVAEQASRVWAVLENIGSDPVIVIGHSSGGYVATALAEERPDLVRAVALVNTGPRPDALWPQPAVVRALSSRLLRRVAWSLRSLAIRPALRSAFTRPVDIPDDLVAAARGMTYTAFANAPSQSTAYIVERALPDRLAALDLPLLVIFGADDHRWNSSSAHVYEVVPGARLEMLAGIGHTPMFEAPEVTSRLLLDFAASC
jgi:pimeloyl-ACP methyl ester carboxylesterase